MENSTSKNSIPRKASQEVELDYLFAEEYTCDPIFFQKVSKFCEINSDNLVVENVTIQPKLSAGGYGDLLVSAKSKNKRCALLIEHKITAGPALRQAERYRLEADKMRSTEINAVTVLVAPKSYSGEARNYDHCISLEDMVGMLGNADNHRLDYRRSRILAALEKKKSSGVQNHDEAVLELHKRYREVAEDYCKKAEIPLEFPDLKLNYYDGDAWVFPICHCDLPNGIVLRHRLWISLANNDGQVDLIVREADENHRDRFNNQRPAGAESEKFSEERGVQISYKLPALKSDTEFCSEVVKEACNKMSDLVTWYKNE